MKIASVAIIDVGEYQAWRKNRTAGEVAKIMDELCRAWIDEDWAFVKKYPWFGR